jgi:hypothetical protein
MPDLEDLFSEIERLHSRKACSNPGAVTDLEQRLGCFFPDDIKAFHRRYDTVRLFADECGDAPYRFVPAGEIHPTRKDVHGEDADAWGPGTWLTVCDGAGRQLHRRRYRIARRRALQLHRLLSRNLRDAGSVHHRGRVLRGIAGSRVARGARAFIGCRKASPAMATAGRFRPRTRRFGSAIREPRGRDGLWSLLLTTRGTASSSATMNSAAKRRPMMR